MDARPKSTKFDHLEKSMFLHQHDTSEREQSIDTHFSAQISLKATKRAVQSVGLP